MSVSHVTPLFSVGYATKQTTISLMLVTNNVICVCWRAAYNVLVYISVEYVI